MRTKAPCAIAIGAIAIVLFGARVLRTPKFTTPPVTPTTVPTASTAQPANEPGAPSEGISNPFAQATIPLAMPPDDIAGKPSAFPPHSAPAGRSPQDMATLGIARVEEMIAQHGVDESQAPELRHQMAARMIASGADRTAVEKWLDTKGARRAVSRRAVDPGVDEIVSAPSPSADAPASPNIERWSADERAAMEMNANYISTQLRKQNEATNKVHEEIVQ